jgi:CRP/FNR family transcriptional regulator
VIESDSSSNAVWCLSHTLLRGMSPQVKARHDLLLTHTKYPPKSRIFAPGDVSDRIYLIMSGHVRLFSLHEDGKEVTLAVLGPGDVFGELALFSEKQRLRFAETMDEAVICSAPIAEFLEIMSDVPELTRQIAAIITRRVLQAEMQIENLAYSGVRGRIIGVLLELAQTVGQQVEDGTKIALRLSRQDLASFAGTSRETCSIELQRLAREDVIGFTDDGYIVVKDLSKLRPGLADRIRAALRISV